MPIRAVIWDLGGVLLRTEDRTPRQEAAARLGLTYEQLDDLVFNGELGRRAQRGEISPQELWAEVGRTLRLPAEELPGLQQAFFGGDVLDTGLLDYIRSLRLRVRTGVISNAWSNLRWFMSERWGMMDAFDHIVISGECGVMKPDPQIYQLSLQGLQVAPQEAVFIDDNQDNVEGARAVGMHAIRFRDRAEVLAGLEKLLEG